jgi:DNA-binding transcriptional regulator YiaG
MTITTNRKRAAKRQLKKPVVRVTKSAANTSPSISASQLRSRLVLTQAEFARLLPVSVRSLATIESGTPPTEPVVRRLIELKRLTNALSEVIKKESLGMWLKAPNQAFDGLKPVEVIERGESDRLWEMIYFLRSGVPS